MQNHHLSLAQSSSWRRKDQTWVYQTVGFNETLKYAWLEIILLITQLILLKSVFFRNFMHWVRWQCVYLFICFFFFDRRIKISGKQSTAFSINRSSFRMYFLIALIWQVLLWELLSLEHKPLTAGKRFSPYQHKISFVLKTLRVQLVWRTWLRYLLG